MRLLDLFCGAGGAAMGYYRAGFNHIVGVDINEQPNYPFIFQKGDALEYLEKYGDRFDVIHASPPCQAYTWAAARWDRDYPDLVEKTQKLLYKTGKPFVIENVREAGLNASLMLCGTMFGLKVIRHRYFEIHPEIPILTHSCNHNGSVKNGDFVTVAGHGGDGIARLDVWKDAMGISWMTKEELTEAIPPAYTEFIGRRIMEVEFTGRVKE